MTAWDYLGKIQKHLPLFLVTPTVIVVVAISIFGFCTKGANFFKFGFSDLPTVPMEVASKGDIAKLEADITTIKTNDLEHIYNYLRRFSAILLDQKIITNDQSEQLRQTLDR